MMGTWQQRADSKHGDPREMWWKSKQSEMQKTDHIILDRMAGSPAWPPLWRSTKPPNEPQDTRAKIMNLQMLSQLAPTCSFLVAETSPSSSGTSPAMRPRTATPSAVSTATLTSSPTVYVKYSTLEDCVDILESRAV